MTESHAKTTIFVLRSLDWVILLAVLGFGSYFMLYSNHRPLMALAMFVGLFLVNAIGNYTTEKIAQMRVNMEIQARNKYKKI